MNEAVATLRAEAPDAPRSKRYARASEADAAPGDILAVSTDLAGLVFDDQVAAFAGKLDVSLAEAAQDSPPSGKRANVLQISFMIQSGAAREETVPHPVVNLSWESRS
jgi:hypothetical protein